MKNFEFYSLDESIAYSYPIKRITELEMPWVKLSQKHFAETKKDFSQQNHVASHMCSGIRGVMENGWVITMPNDIYIETNGTENITWATPDVSKKLNFFPPELFGNYVNLPPSTLKTIIKIDTTWRFKAPDGWGLLMLPIQYISENRFTSTMGIIDPKICNSINPVLFWHTINGNEMIKAGTPLCQLIPIKLDKFDNEFNAIIRNSTEKERQFESVYINTKRNTWVTDRKLLINLYNKFFNKN